MQPSNWPGIRIHQHEMRRNKKELKMSTKMLMKWSTATRTMYSKHVDTVKASLPGINSLVMYNGKSAVWNVGTLNIKGYCG